MRTRKIWTSKWDGSDHEIQKGRLGAVGAGGIESPFNAKVIEIWQGEYILRDADRNRWLRKETEVSLLTKKEAA
jgi:hypothetical protein